MQSAVSGNVWPCPLAFDCIPLMLGDDCIPLILGDGEDQVATSVPNAGSAYQGIDQALEGVPGACNMSSAYVETCDVLCDPAVAGAPELERDS
jgi:hypothetical protein